MHSDSVGSFSPHALESFVAAHHVSQGAAVAGVGVDHDQLVLLARKMSFHQGGATAPETKKSKYHGGELRVHARSPLVHAALVTEGVAESSPQDVLAISLLQLVLGVGPYVKYGSSVATAKINKAAHSAVSSGPVAASCINVSYSDSGLFGFRVVAGPKDVRKALTAIVGAMGQATKGSVSDADLQRAKKQLKSAVHMDNEDSAALLDSISTAALLSGRAVDVSPAAVDAAIDKITAEEVSKIAKKVINGKPTFAAVGDLTHTPYLDELVSRA
jgi:ubiquinol-cytochrome c reductase core subunit 2